MSYRAKVRVTGNVICAQSGKAVTNLRGRTGRVAMYAAEGMIAVVQIDGVRYHIPVNMIETLPVVKGGVDSA